MTGTILRMCNPSCFLKKNKDWCAAWTLGPFLRQTSYAGELFALARVYFNSLPLSKKKEKVKGKKGLSSGTIVFWMVPMLPIVRRVAR